MSEQRRMRAELKQGLHQFLMSLYRNYQQSMTHETSVEQIKTGLQEEYAYFSNGSIQQEQPKSLDVSDYIQEIEKQARKEKDSNKQFELYQDLEALMSAQEVLKKYNMTNNTTEEK